MKVFFLLNISFILATIECCFHVEISSTVLGIVRFNQLYLDDSFAENEYFYNSGRPIYISEIKDTDSGPLYIYHTVGDNLVHGVDHNGNKLIDLTGSSGVGRWIVNQKLGKKDEAMAYIDSWAITPYLWKTVTSTDYEDHIGWRIPNQDGWEYDPSLEIKCVDEEDDNSFYFESSQFQPSLSGFYVQRYLSNNSGKTKNNLKVIYTQIKHSINDLQKYLFKNERDEWMIGDNYLLDSANAYLMKSSPNHYFDVEDANLLHNNWHFINAFDVTNHSWIHDESAMLYSKHLNKFKTESYDVFIAMKSSRTIQYVPNDQGFTYLRNGLPIMYMGLGTGGIYTEDCFEVFIKALKAGYRLFDLAREYGNEHIMGEVMKSNHIKSLQLSRKDLFLETKVWPTELGFLPTLHAISTSLSLLQTNYIDLYLLHWPSCDPNIEWMHCETTIEKDATWKESWRALEKAYAEGTVLSIGVSNFNVMQLNELQSFASVLPHVVQNWAEIGNIDLEVRDWCELHGVIYQPYATLRNLKQSSFRNAMQNRISQIASKRGKSIQDVVLRFFLQTGAGVIPRSIRVEHLKDNLKAFKWKLSAAEMFLLGWNNEGIEHHVTLEDEEL
eukprot:gene12010-16078_t